MRKTRAASPPPPSALRMCVACTSHYSVLIAIAEADRNSDIETELSPHILDSAGGTICVSRDPRIGRVILASGGRAAPHWFHQSQKSWTWRTPILLFGNGWERSRDRT